MGIEKGNLIIDIDKENKIVKIIPKGFWCAMVTISQHFSFAKRKDKEPEISYSGGGEDGSLSKKETSDNFIEALNEAREIVKNWDALIEDTR